MAHLRSELVLPALRAQPPLQLCLDDFRSAVGRGPRQRVVERQVAVRHQPGQAQVRQFGLCPAALEQDVQALHVQVDQALAVQEDQCRRDINRNAPTPADDQRASANCLLRCLVKVSEKALPGACWNPGCSKGLQLLITDAGDRDIQVVQRCGSNALRAAPEIPQHAVC